MVFTSQLLRTSFLMICVQLLNGQSGQIALPHVEKDLNLGSEDFLTGNKYKNSFRKDSKKMEN